MPVSAADVFWDADGAAGAPTGGSGNWNLVDPFWNDDGTMRIWSNTAGDTAVFGGTVGTVTLTDAITAGALSFQTGGYLITGNTLTLDPPAGTLSPQVSVGGFSRVTIASQLSGTSGLTKVGDGTLILTNNLNNYTGDTVINAGALVISNQAQLGLSTGTISINGLGNTGNPGYSGGSLILNGISGGVVMTREISVSGRGPGAVNAGGGLVSVGNNTLAGHIVLGGTGSEGRLLATHGVTTITGGVQLGSGTPQYLFGNGNWIVSSVVTGYDTGNDRFVKTGNVVGTTLWLQNENNNFAQPIRIDSGTVRVTAVGALGRNPGPAAVDLNTGVLEIRTDAVDFSSRKIRKRGNGGGIFVDHFMGSSLLNQTVTFGGISMDANADFTLSGRNGYGAVLTGLADGGATINWTNGGTGALRNSSSGLLTVDADINRLSETGARTFTFGINGGDGDIVLTGSLLQTGTGVVTLHKIGTGKLTIGGDASTYTGLTLIRQGTLSISSFGALGTNPVIEMGGKGESSLPAASVTAALEYTGGTATTDKVINLVGTTGGAILLANGSGAITFTSDFVASGAGSKRVTLGGVGTADNTIGGAIVDNSGTNITSVTKMGSGTWVLSGANTYTGATTISEGTLKIQDTYGGDSRNVVNDVSALVFNVNTFNQAAGGTLEYRGTEDQASYEIFANLTLTAGAAVLRASNTGVGTAQLGFTTMGTRSAGATVDFAPGPGGVIGFQNLPATLNDDILGGFATFNGVDWVGLSSLLTEQYTGYLALPTTGALATGNYLVDASIVTDATAQTINSLKIAAALPSLDPLQVTLGAQLTIDTGGILFDNTNAAAEISGAQLGAGGTEVIVITNGATPGNTLSIASVIGGGAGQLTKSGTGTLVLSGMNVFTGSVHINEGTLQLSGAGARLGASQTASTALNLRQHATLDLNGAGAATALYTGGPSVAAVVVGALNGAGTITNSGGGGNDASALIIGNGSTTTAAGLFTGLIEDGAGPLSVVKRGTGVQSITGLNTYTGATVIASGTLAVTSLADIGEDSGIGRGDDTSDATNAASLVFAGGTLTYTGATAAIAQDVMTPSISINRLFTLAANGAISSEGSRGNVMPTTRAANHAALVFNNTAPVAFAGAGVRTLTLTGDSVGDNRMRLQLINNTNAGEALSLTKGGTGLWILDPAVANTYSGVTTISAGALQAVDGFGVPTGSNILLSGGVFQTFGTFNRTLGAGADEVRWTANGNGGFAASTSKLTVDLGTGPFVWGGTTNFLAAGTLILNSNTALADVEFTDDFEVIPGIEKALTLTTATTTTTVTITGGGNTTGLTVGQTITGNPNIPAGAYISGIINATQFSLSVTPTAAGTGVASTINAGGFRQIQVDDNTSTGLDFATVSGVISGAGGIGKSGAGTLILGDANTYLGDTVLRDGATFATSIGAAGAASSSFGSNVGGGSLMIGNPNTTTTVNLMYVGPGEIATRLVQLIGTIGTRRIDSSGSGALVLTNLVNGGGGAKTLDLRGTNTDGNMVGSVLADNGGALTVTKSDGGVWILNPSGANSFTGALNVSGGLLGLTADGIGTASQINFSNAGIFAHGGPLTITRPVQLNNNTTAGFAGSNNITLDNTVTKQAGTSDQTISNNLENGAVLTVNGNFVNAQTATGTRTVFHRGYGSTVWNGLIQNNSATSLTRFDIRIADDASFTIGGDNKNAALGFTGGLLLGQGTLVVGHVGALGPTANNIILDGGTFTSAVDLTGANKITNLIQLQGDHMTIAGSRSIEFGGATALEQNGNRHLVNNLDDGKKLTISGQIRLTTDANARTLTVRGTGVTEITGVIANGGTGASGLAFSGLGSLVLTGANTATGSLTVNRNLIVLTGPDGSWNNGNFVLNPTGTLRLDNTDGDNVNGRLNNGGTFTGAGGTLEILGDADGSTHTAGALTLNSVQTFIKMSGPAANSLNFASVNFANTGSSLNLADVVDLGVTNKVTFTAALAATALINGVMPRAFIGGQDFATYHATDGVKAFTGYVTDLNAAAATETLALTAGANLAASKTINALKLDGTGMTVGGSTRTTITLAAAALLNTGGDNTLAMPFLSFAGLTGHIQVAAGTTLEIDSTLIGTGGFAKSLPGTMVINSPSFLTSSQNLLNGTLKLNAGLNTLFPGQLLVINNGATLDLNGNTQYFAEISDPGTLPGAGGTITTSTGTATLVTNMNAADQTVMTQITGNINFVRVGTRTLTLGSEQTYTGATIMMGGTLALQDDATILQSSGIELNAAILHLNNNGSLQTANYDRIGDNIPITLRNGTLQFTGKVSDASTERFGMLISAQGANTVTVATGGTGTAGAFASADVTFAGLTRELGTTVNFTGSTALGSIGNFPRIRFDVAPQTYLNGLLGPWAISNSTDYAAYNSVNGVGTVGNGGYTGYEASFGSGNVTNLHAVSEVTTTTVASDTTSAMLRLSGAYASNLAFTAGDEVLNLELGGLLRSNNAATTSIGTTAVRGVLTAGGDETSGVRELIVYGAASANPTFGSGTVTAGSARVTVSTTAGLLPGMTVTNPNFPAGTTVVSIDSATTVTLSNPATAAGTSQTLTAGSIDLGELSLGSNVVTLSSTVGLSPGMTITNANLPAGTYVLSVDGPTQITVSQNATASASGQTLVMGMSNFIINSVVADNGQGNSVRFIKSGAGVLNLSANNTYTGGTVVDQGTVNLIGSGVVIPAGGILLDGAVMNMLTNAGQIDPTNVVTLRRSSTLGLVGDNTLAALVFDNSGGTGTPTVTVGAGNTLTLTSSAPVTVTSNNALTVPTINLGTLNLGTGAKTFSVGAPTAAGEVYNRIVASLNITSSIVGAGASIVKTDDGLLQLSGQSTFDGGVVVQAGGLIIGASSTATTLAAGLVSGPLGTGTLTMADGTRLVVNDTRTIANPITFQGTANIDNVNTTLRTFTLNGPLTFSTLATTGAHVDIATPAVNLVLAGRITGMEGVTGVGGAPGANKLTWSGLGNVTGLNLTGIDDTVPITIDVAAGSFSLLHDGDGTGGFETINLGPINWNSPTGTITLTINRAGTDEFYATALYKTIAPAAFNSPQLANGLTLANSNLYGLLLVDDIAFNTVATDVGPTFNVGTANNSLQLPGLTLNGVLSGGPTGATARTLIKSGNGILFLANAGNTFGGGGSIIDVTDGTVQAAADSAFGHADNVIRLSANSLSEGLRITGTFATNRQIIMEDASSGIDVTAGNTFTLNSAISFVAATNAWRKNELGTLVLTQAQPDWNGVVTIGQGVLRITDGAALGTTTGNLIIANISATLDLPGGVTVNDNVQIASTNNSSSNGVNSLGAIYSSGGTNTVAGTITIDTTTSSSQSRSGTLRATAGSTLNITGGIVLGVGTSGSARDNWIGFGGAGTINLTDVGITYTGNLANGIASITKFDSGTLNFEVGGGFTGQRVIVKSGDLVFRGAGSLGAVGPGAIAAEIGIYLNPTGRLTLDNTLQNVDNRLGGRQLSISGGADVTIIGNAAAPTNETIGVFTLREGATSITLAADAAQQISFTTGTITRSAGSTLLVRGTNFGAAPSAGTPVMTGNAYAFVGQLGATGATNKSILGWGFADTSATGGGAFFLTADSLDAAANTGANALRPLSATEQVADFGTAGANVSLSTTELLASLTTFNSLRLDAGGGVNLYYAPLSLDSGAVLALSGNTGINGFSGASYLTSATAAREIILYTAGDLTLNVPIVGVTGGVTKSGAGTLTLTGGSTNHGQVTINEGTLKLGGGDQTILPGRNVFVNDGGVLDLNGTIQAVNILESRQSAALARNDIHFGGGTVINTGATQAVLAMTTSSSIFAGSIGNGNAAESNIAVVRSHAAGSTADWNLYAPQTYTGPTLYNGGRTILNDGASLTATSALELTNASLLISASNNTTEQTNLTDRINDAAAITLRGAMLQFRGRAGLISTETLGAVTLGEGNTVIDFAEGGTAVNRSEVTFASLARTAGSKGTVRFLNIDGLPSDDQQLFINNLNGVPTTTVGAGLTNHIIGGWAVFEREFAGYNPGQGIGGLSTAGFAGYATRTLDTALATDNIRLFTTPGSTTVMTGDRTLNSFALLNGSNTSVTTTAGGVTATVTGSALGLFVGQVISGNANIPAGTTITAINGTTITLSTPATVAGSNVNTSFGGNTLLDLGGFTLTIGSGGLIASTAADGTLTTITNGKLTAGAPNVGGDLYLHGITWFNGQADNTGNRDIAVSADIVDNGTGAVSLVVVGNTGRGTLAATNDIFLSGNNTYTGGTFVNSGLVRLSNAAADGVNFFAVPGDLTIAGGYSGNAGAFTDRNTTVILQGSGQIKHTAFVTIKGGATLDLANFNQTIAGLSFENHGGTTPTLATGTGTLTLTAATITAVGQNLGSISTISGKLALTAATTTLDVDAVKWNGVNLNPFQPNLLISAVIDGGNLVKTGDGLMRVTAANGFTGDFELQAGGLSLGNNNALSSAVLTIGDGTYLTSTDNARVIANSFVAHGDFALRDVFNLTINGAGHLSFGVHSINVEFATKILTLGGVLGGTGAHLTKTGDGILLFNQPAAYDGSTTVADGTLRYGVVNAVPTTSAVTVLAGGVLDITGGGSNVVLASLAGNSATAGGLVYTTATSGNVSLTVGGNGMGTEFGGTIANASGSTLELVKVGSGTLTLGGVNAYNGATTIADGRLVAKAVAGGSALGTSGSVLFGGDGTSGVLQLGDASAPLNQTFTSVGMAGTGTLNAIVGGNASISTLTFDLATTSTFAGNFGGGGTNEANLSLVKNGGGDLVVTGTGSSNYNGTTSVAGGKLFFDTPGGFSSSTTSLTLADGTEFALRGAVSTNQVIYNFAGVGNKITVGTSTGATLGFSLNGAFNTQLNLAAGQTMTVNGQLTTAIYVNGAPIGGQAYVLINGTDANSLHAGGGTFDLNPVIFNGGSFTYALSQGSGVNGGGQDQWIITPTAVAAADHVWWKGDLTGLGLGVWSATTIVNTGAPSNWDDDETSGNDAQVPPDAGSIVHFSAVGAANFDTTLGANLTIQELIFHTGNPATTIGNSNGANTLTLGNGIDGSGLTIQSGAGNVAISAAVAVGQNQDWNLMDTATLTLSGGLHGAGLLGVNTVGGAGGSLIISGTAGTFAGTLTMNVGNLIFDDLGSLSTAADIVLGNATTSAVLRVGNTSAATGATIGGLSNGAAAGSRVVGGNASVSTLFLGPASGTAIFAGALGGAGTNENQLAIVKTGAGTQVLDGAATYAGSTTVREGVLQLGAASTFAPTGSLAIVAAAGATATFDLNGKNFTSTGDVVLGGLGAGAAAVIADTATTKGTFTLGGNLIYDAANSPAGAVVSANLVGNGGNRTITVNPAGNVNDLSLLGTYTVVTDNNLTFAGAGNGLVGGNISLNLSTGTGGSNDVNFSHTGTWTINAKIEVDDDIILNTGTVVATALESLDATDDVILDGTGVPGSVILDIDTAGAGQVHTGDDFFIRNGALVNVFGSGGIGTGTDSLTIGDSASNTVASAGVLNLVSGAAITPTSMILGAAGGQTGHIKGTGTITTTGTKTISNGTIEAGITLAGNGAISKTTTGTVLFAGSRAPASTGGFNLQEGTLILDYTTNNTAKMGGVFSLGLATGTDRRVLTINGNADADTVQGVTSTTILPGRSTIAINNGAGRAATLNLGAITRTTAGGFVAFEYSSSAAKATTTSAAQTLGWATVTTGLGDTRLAAIASDGDIVQATYTTQNDLTQWGAGMNVVATAPVVGAVDDCNSVDSLTLTGTGASTITVAADARFTIGSGALVVDSAVGAFDTVITGGQLSGATTGALGELLIYQNNAAGDLVIASSIVNSAGITKTGAGTLVLNGANTFRRTVSLLHVDQGTVRIGNDAALATNTSLLLRAGATLDVNGRNLVIGHLASNSAGTIALGSGSLGVTQTASNTFSGQITGDSASVFTINSGTFNFNITSSITTGFTGSVVISNGLLQLSGAAGRLSGVTSFTINKGGNFLIDNNDNAAPNDRISNSAAFTLNSADGAFSGETQPRGLAIRTDDNNSDESETIGVLTFASGASYSAMENHTGTSAQANIIAADWVRNLGATINVRGENLGAATNARTNFKIVDGATEVAFLASANLIGGTGAAGTTSRKIVPWAIGENTGTAAVAAAHMGNSLVTYVDNVGFVPLNLTTEYATYAAAGALDNVRQSITANLTGLAGKTINSLVLHNNNTSASTLDVTGNGAATALVNAGGAFLFTLNTTATGAHAVNLGGFDDGIQVGSSNEYVFWVVNPSSATTTAVLTATVSSPLNSVSAALTKSGRGTLVLSGTNTYGGGTFVNEGVLQIASADNIGTGGVTLAGGTLRAIANINFENRPLGALLGGGTLDVGTADVEFTGQSLFGPGQLTKIGSGTLTLGNAAPAANTGTFRVTAGTIVLNNIGGNAVGGTLVIGATAASTSVTGRLGTSEQIADTARLEVINNTGTLQMFDLDGNTETVAGLSILSTSSTGAVIKTGASGVLVVKGDIILNNDRVADASTTEFQVLITGGGAVGTRTTNGVLDLGGEARRIYVDSIQTNTTFRNDATIETVIRNGAIIKEGPRMLHLRAANTYAGTTTINNGAIAITAAENLGDGSATNSIVLNGGTLRAGASFDLGVNRAIELGYSGGTLEVTGTFAMSVSGVISGDECAVLNKIGAGTVALTGTNTYLGTTNIAAGTLQLGDGGTSGTFGTGAVTNFATLAFNRSDSFLVGNAISGTGAVRQVGVGRTTLTGANVYTGTTTVAAGTLQFAAPQAFYNGNQADWTAAKLIVDPGATAAFNVGGVGEFSTAQIDAVATIGTAAGGFRDGSFLGFDTTNAPGGTFTYGSIVADTNAGANALGVAKLGAGTLVLTNLNTYTGATKILAGTLEIAQEANLGVAPSTFAPAQLLIDGGTLATSASFDIDDANRGITVGNAGGTIQVAATTKLGVANAVAGDGTLTKQGAGTLTFTGATVHTHTGDMLVAAGNVNGTATLTSRVVVQSGGTLSAGSDTAVGNNSDGVGQMNLAGGAEWQGGGTLVFDFADTVGTAGTNWDFFNINGVLDINASSSSQITLYVDSWLANLSDYGQAGNFDLNTPPTNETTVPPHSYQWLWATASGGVKLNGVDVTDMNLSDIFAVDANRPGTGAIAAFPPGTNVGGTFWVSAMNNSLYINYSSVPEPGSMLLIGVAGLGFAAYRRRRRLAADESSPSQSDSATSP